MLQKIVMYLVTTCILGIEMIDNTYFIYFRVSFFSGRLEFEFITIINTFHLLNKNLTRIDFEFPATTQS